MFKKAVHLHQVVTSDFQQVLQDKKKNNQINPLTIPQRPTIIKDHKDPIKGHLGVLVDSLNLKSLKHYPHCVSVQLSWRLPGGLAQQP